MGERPNYEDIATVRSRRGHAGAWPGASTSPLGKQMTTDETGER